jgi:hypothetical protein
MALTSTLLRPTAFSTQVDYATYIKAAANNYAMTRPVTITIASPAVVTMTNERHGYVTGNTVVFSTSGALPTGITAGVTYYVKDVRSAYEFTISSTNGGANINTSGTQSGTHAVPWPSWKSNEHNSIMNFVPRSAATKVFCPRSGAANVNTGNWNVAGNWYPNGVPGLDDKVLIGEGVTCVYDITASSPDLFWIRQDGTFQIVGDTNISLLVDTWVATESSSVKFGTVFAPVRADVVIDIKFSAARGWIDVTADTFKQSRGFVWIGKGESGGNIRVFGGPKDEYLRLASHTVPNVGATSFTFASAPSGWRVGDRLLVPTSVHDQYFPTRADTTWNDWRWNNEYVTITSIAGSTVNFTPALTKDHRPPVCAWANRQPRLPIFNLTRNVQFETKDGSTVDDIQKLAHSMLMHTNDVVFEYASFRWMGRTAKNASLGVVGHSYLSWGAAANTPWVFNGRYAINGGTECVFPTQMWVDFNEIAPTPTSNPSWPYTVTIEGYDGAGNFQTETFTITENFGRRRTVPMTTWTIGGNDATAPRTEKFWKRITRIVSDKAVKAGGPLSINPRSFRMTGSGVRIPIGGPNDEASATWQYQPVTPQTNIQGRYAFHVHRGGSSMTEMKVNGTATGLVVEDTAGWAYAHHDAHFNFIRCGFAKAGGAGFVAERGSETGMWHECWGGDVRGDGDVSLKSEITTLWGDPAVMSVGSWWSGRSVGANGCIMFACAVGYGFNTRFGESSTLIVEEQLELPELAKGKPAMYGNIPHIRLFKDNEGFGCGQGAEVVKTDPGQDHMMRTVIDAPTFWNCDTLSLNLTYTGHYTSLDVLSIGAPHISEYGIGLGINSTDQTFIRPLIQGPIRNGAINIGHTRTTGNSNYEANRRIVVDAQFSGSIGAFYGDYDPNIDIVTTSANLGPDQPPQISWPWYPSPKYITRAGFTATPGGPVYNYGWNISHGPNNYIMSSDRVKANDPYPWGYVPNGGIESSRVDDAWMPNLAAREGYWVNSDDNKKYIFCDEIYADRLTGEVFKIVAPLQHDSYTGTNLRGTCKLSNMTPPTAQNIAVTCIKNQSIQITPLNFSSHPNGRLIHFRGNTQPDNGVVTRNGYSVSSPGDGTITYTPLRGFTGTDTFKYWVADQDGNISSQRGSTITVTVLDDTVFEPGSYALTGNPATLTYVQVPQLYVITKFNCFMLDLGKGVHDFTSNTFKVAFSNSPPQATWTKLSDVPQVGASGGYVAGGFALTVSWAETGGKGTLYIADKQVVGSGAGYSMRYAVIYNDTSVDDSLIGWLDFGSITLNANDALNMNFNEATGALTVQ